MLFFYQVITLLFKFFLEKCNQVLYEFGIHKFLLSDSSKKNIVFLFIWKEMTKEGLKIKLIATVLHYIYIHLHFISVFKWKVCSSNLNF